MSATFAIQGMTCDKCRAKVAAALGGLAPDVTVTREPPRAVFPGPASIATQAVQQALRAVGNYTATPLPSELAAVEPAATVEASLAVYYPLLLIAAYVGIAALAGTTQTGLAGWMTNFMAGFFLVFSFFKLLDLRGFADAYAGYDLLAARWRPWGLLYPFVELALGLAYLFRWQLFAANIVTLVIMLFGALGVQQALAGGQKIRCACLGAVLNLPMSTVTLVEDGLMAAMAAAMLLAMPMSL